MVTTSRRYSMAVSMVLMVLGLCWSGAGSAQGYPGKPVRMIVPVSPGGALDLIGRALAQKLSVGLGQPVVVENKPGVSTIVGTEYVAKAAPDGYTLLMTATTFGSNAAVHTKLPYDTARDFTPISLVATIPHVLVVNPQLPVKTLQDFVQLAKSHPGMAYGTVGAGSPHHLAAEWFKQISGIDMVHVPYKGTAPAMADLVSGTIQFMSVEWTAASPYVASGRMRALAMATPARLPGVDVPTTAEAGYPGFQVSSWYGLLGPAGMPAEVVSRIHAEVVKSLQQPDLKERFNSLGTTIVGSTPAEFAAFLQGEIARWTKVAEAGHITSEE